MPQIDEIVDGIYRISTPPDPDVPISFNQFLIEDEQPVLVHTGVHQAYDGIHKAISEVLDPARLAYVVLLHFEGDECGGMDGFLGEGENTPPGGAATSPVPHPTSLCGFYREIGIFAHEEPVRRCIDRLEQLDSQWVHAMHGGTLTGAILPRYNQALREQAFAYQGGILGRPI